MDEELMDRLLAVMTAAGLPEDSSQEIAFHLALHFPMHAQALLDAQVTPELDAEG